MKKLWRKAKKDTDERGAALGGGPAESHAEPERLWPIIDVLEAEKDQTGKS